MFKSLRPKAGAYPFVFVLTLIISWILAARPAEAQLADAQREAILQDLDVARALGRNVRLLTFTSVNDPAYDLWPKPTFLTFPQPTVAELQNLKWFSLMVANAGLRLEVVLLMPDAAGLYYQHDVKTDDYRTFIDAIWSATGNGSAQVVLGGDLRLGSQDVDPAMVTNHRRWVQDLWPYLVDKCPGCSFGPNLSSAYKSFWDRCADSKVWIRDNLSRLPDYVGCQLYPSTHAALRALGFEHNGIVDWNALVGDWIDGTSKAAGSIPVKADEVGLAIGGDFNKEDQRDFLTAARIRFLMNGTPVNIWQLVDQPPIGGHYGMLTQCHQPRPAAMVMQLMSRSWSAWSLMGAQFGPAGYGGLAWLMPGGTPTIQITCSPSD